MATKGGRRRLLDLLSLLLVVAIFALVFPRIASYREVGDVLGGLGAAAIAGLVALAVWNLVTYWLVTIAVLPALRLREAAVSNLGSTAVSTRCRPGPRWGWA